MTSLAVKLVYLKKVIFIVLLFFICIECVCFPTPYSFVFFPLKYVL